jgi:uncharacterized protein with PIN domain
VYPECERLDSTPPHRLRRTPLREPRSVAAGHLGALARHLRLLGFDTRGRNDLTDAELADLTTRERRTLLTRDVELLKRRAVVRGQWLRDCDPERQLAEVVAALDLRRAMRPFSRCLICNGRLAPVPRATVAGLVPPRVYRRFRAFIRCRNCRRLYWRGTHFERLQRLVAQVRAQDG